MLNELHTLSASLSAMGLKAPDWHRDYKELPQVTDKSPGVRIWLTETAPGTVENIEEIEAGLASTLRKYGNNQMTFPAFNIAPLYRITEEAQIKALGRMLKNEAPFDFEAVKSWCLEDNWDRKLIQKINNCLFNISDKLYKQIIEQTADDQSLVVKLIECAKFFSTSKVSFRSALERSVFENLQKREGLKIALRVLFHKGHPGKDPGNDRGTLSVMLDLAEWPKYGNPVANEQTTRWTNDILLKSDRADKPAPALGDRLDAYGAAYRDVGRPMPEVKVKGFTVRLRAMFHEQPCQYRYGKINDASFPMTEEHRAEAKKALEFIAQDKKQGLTWQGLTWQTAGQDEIAFVYPASLPEVPQKFASLFAPSRADGAQAEARFENIAAEIVKNLKGTPSEDPPDNIRVFALRKMDKARTKVVFNRNYSAECFIDAAEKWQEGCENIPNIYLSTFSPKKSPSATAKKEKAELEVFSPLTPFPLQIPTIINKVWKRDGKAVTEKTSIIKRMHYYQGLELLLDPPKKDVIGRYLRILLLHSTGLLLYVGDEQHRGRASSPIQAKESGSVLSALGLLLYKCDYNLEGYMEDTAYLLGQTLKVSDELHAFYCEKVRDKAIPPQLAGNALFITAMENPNQALAQLAKRMPPYIALAQQYCRKDADDSWKARWYLHLYEKTLSKMEPKLVNKMRFDDFAKAQLFIGYLAAFPKSEMNAADTAKTVQGENDEQGN
jgi:hypothetical protein